MINKRVEYSHPTSPNAKALGFYKAGCYSIEVGEVNGSKKTVAGFVTLEDAKAFVEKLPQPWDRYIR